MCPALMFIALQLIIVDVKEQVIGSSITAIDVNVHVNDLYDPFEGHFSSSVRFPSNENEKCSMSGSDDWLDVAFTEFAISQVLPTTLIVVPNILVSFDTAALFEITM